MRISQDDQQTNFQLAVDWGSRFDTKDRRAIARYFGVTLRTVQRWFNPDPFAQRLPFLHPRVSEERREFAEALLEGYKRPGIRIGSYIDSQGRGTIVDAAEQVMRYRALNAGAWKQNSALTAHVMKDGGQWVVRVTYSSDT